MKITVNIDPRVVYVLQERAQATGLDFDTVVNDALGYVIARPRSQSPLPTRVGVYVRAGYTDKEIAHLLALPLSRVGGMRRDQGLKPNKPRPQRA